MARAFATNQQINGTTTVAKNLTNFSMAGWVRRPTTGSIQWFGSSENANHTAGIGFFANNSLYFAIGNGSNTSRYVTDTSTGWFHVAFSYDGSQTGNANRLKIYKNGALQTTGVTESGTIPATTSNNASMDTYRIGRYQSGALWSTGDFAELGMWQASLSDDEIASLGDGMTCEKIRPQSLVYYTPLVRDIQDLARGMTLTDTSTTVATHPRVYA
jgi:hypothetical protein